MAYYINFFPHYQAKTVEQTLRKLLKEETSSFRAAMALFDIWLKYYKIKEDK